MSLGLRGSSSVAHRPNRRGQARRRDPCLGAPKCLRSLGLPKAAPCDLRLFDQSSEDASAEFGEWLELVGDKQTDAVNAWHHCMRTWVGV